MRVKLVNALGQEYLLPETLAIEGYPEETDLPGVRIQGRPGRLLDRSTASMNSRQVRVSGSIEGISRADAESLRAAIAAFLNRNNPLRLYADEETTRYLVVDKKSIDHSYKVGYFGGRLFSLAITFEAADPYFHETVHYAQRALTQQPGVPFPFALDGYGTVSVSPVILISGLNGASLANPQVTMGGITVKYVGSVPANQYLVVDCENLTAWLAATAAPLADHSYLPTWQIDAAGTSVLNNMSDDWLLDKLRIQEGSNDFEYIDANETAHEVSVELRWIPAFY